MEVLVGAIGWIVVELLFFGVFYGIGWAVINVVTLGKHPGPWRGAGVSVVSVRGNAPSASPDTGAARNRAADNRDRTTAARMRESGERRRQRAARPAPREAARYHRPAAWPSHSL